MYGLVELFRLLGVMFEGCSVVIVGLTWLRKKLTRNTSGWKLTMTATTLDHASTKISSSLFMISIVCIYQGK